MLVRGWGFLYSEKCCFFFFLALAYQYGFALLMSTNNIEKEEKKQHLDQSGSSLVFSSPELCSG